MKAYVDVNVDGLEPNHTVGRIRVTVEIVEIRATVQIKPFWPSLFGFKTYGQSSLD